MSACNFEHATVSEIVERIKDIISTDVDGYVYDHHVSDALHLKASTLRVYKASNHLPIKNIAIFCVSRDVDIRTLIKN